MQVLGFILLIAGAIAAFYGRVKGIEKFFLYGGIASIIGGVLWVFPFLRLTMAFF